MSLNLSSGPNSILIAYLRERDGSAAVNCKELSKKHGLGNTRIYCAADYMRKLGLLTMQKSGYGKPPRITLNEEAIRQYAVSATAVSGGTKTSSGSKTRRNQPFGGIPAEVAKLLESLGKHEFKNPDLVKPLFDMAGVLHLEYKELISALELKQTGIAKLEEALKGFGMNEDEIEKSLNVTAKEIAGIAVYKLVAVPAVEFDKLAQLNEAGSVFKPLATLQDRTRALKNLLIELWRGSFRMNLLEEKMSALLKEKQEAVTDLDEIMANLREWRGKSDRYFTQVDAGIGIAVVATNK